MANKKVATGDWVGGEFRHQPWSTGVDTVVDPDGNPIGGGTTEPLLMFEDTLANTETNPAPWFHNPFPIE